MAAFRKMLALLLAIITLLSLGVTPVFAAEEGQASAPAPVPVEEESDMAPPAPEDVPETDVPPAAEEGTEPEDQTVPAPEPEETEQPEEPAVTPEPEITPEPETTPEPAPEPEITDEPEATAEPETTAEPEPPPEPEITVEEGEPSGEPSDEPETTELKQWPWTDPGNTSVSLTGGGKTLVSGSQFYYSENGSLYLNGTVLANVNAASLNLCDGYLYYTVDSAVYRMPAGGGSAETVHTAEGSIKQLYVMGEELRYLSNGAAWSYDMTDGQTKRLDSPDGLMSLIPTPYGNLYLTGDLFNYTLWANGTALYSGIDSCYTEGEWLVLVTGGNTYQAAVAPLFEGSIDLQGYSLHQDEIPSNGLSDEAQLANEAAFFETDQYAAMQASLVPAENGIATISTSHVLNKTMTANQQNIVLRAQQMAEVKWTPQKDRYAWGGNDTSYVSTKRSRGITLKAEDGTDTSTSYAIFKAGKTYKGVPYSQAVSTGYVGWELSLKGFLQAVANPNSAFYSGYSTYERQAPYYGSDCSGFVSYAWDLPYRCTCTSLANSFSTRIGNDYHALQIGDSINNPSSHVLLVTDLGYDANGNIVSIEITEQTPYKMRVTCYGEVISGKKYDFTGYLSGLTTYYLQAGYTIYRRNCSSRPNVAEPSDDAGLSYASAPTISVKTAGAASATVTLSHENSKAVIYYTLNGSTPSTKSNKYTKPFTVSTTTTVRAIAVVPGYENSFPLNYTVERVSSPTLSTEGDAAYLYDSVYYVKSGSKLTFSSDSGSTIYYTTDGTTPTLSSKSVSTGKATSVSVTSAVTVKAFAVKSGNVPSPVVTMKVQPGKIYTVTVKDPYGFIQIGENTGVLDGKKFSVLEGKDLTVKIRSISGYTFGALKVDGKTVTVSNSTYKLTNVKADHTVTAELKSPFSDVSGSAWYSGAVAFVTAKGLFNGTSSSKFSPNASMTRAMFITVLGRFASPGSSIANWSGKMGVTNGYDIIVRSDTTTSSGRQTIIEAAGQYIHVLGTVSRGKDGGTWYQVQYNNTTGYVRSTLPSNGKTLMYVCQFNDLTSSSVSYCNGYAQWAYLNNIVSGSSSTKFNASGAITRQDICVILYNYLTKYRGISLSTASRSFKDSSSVASYAKSAVNAMANIGVIEGNSSGNFRPTAAATRAEVATMFMRLYDYLY